MLALRGSIPGLWARDVGAPNLGSDDVSEPGWKEVGRLATDSKFPSLLPSWISDEGVEIPACARRASTSCSVIRRVTGRLPWGFGPSWMEPPGLEMVAFTGGSAVRDGEFVGC